MRKPAASWRGSGGQGTPETKGRTLEEFEELLTGENQ